MFAAFARFTHAENTHKSGHKSVYDNVLKFPNVAGEGARRVEKEISQKVIDDDSNAAQIVALDNTPLQ